ncbi:MAG: hypothetical protein IMF19_05535 [Proteobacteria bacterium]|nr:hypothetical protein [Pseudomonadota bacterium]
MNTKIIVALVVGIALVGLTGAASAAYYEIDGYYSYADSAANLFSADTRFETEVVGTDPNGIPIHMQSWIANDMRVTSVSPPSTDVPFVQGGEINLILETDRPGNLNIFESRDIPPYQQINYVDKGEAVDIVFDTESRRDASAHCGIIPIEEMAVWNSNDVWNNAWVNYNGNED